MLSGILATKKKKCDSEEINWHFLWKKVYGIRTSIEPLKSTNTKIRITMCVYHRKIWKKNSQMTTKSLQKGNGNCAAGQIFIQKLMNFIKIFSVWNSRRNPGFSRIPGGLVNFPEISRIFPESRSSGHPVYQIWLKTKC